jgi:transposase
VGFLQKETAMGTPGIVSCIGLDAHRKFSQVSVRGRDGKIMWRARLEHSDRTKLRQQLSRWPQGAPVVLEGSFGWGWLADELAAAGLEPHLAGSRQTAAFRRTRGQAKNNRLDADLLTELWDEKRRWWEVWLAPPEVRDRRELFRLRAGLVQIQTSVKNRLHAVLHRHGVVSELSDLFGVAGRKFLQHLVNRQDARLGESGCATLKVHLQHLGYLRKEIADLTRQVRRIVERQPIGRILVSVPGIGWVLAYTLLAEIGCLERFQNGRKLVSYSLLAPQAQDSGDEDPNPSAAGPACRSHGPANATMGFPGSRPWSGPQRGLLARNVGSGHRERNPQPQSGLYRGGPAVVYGGLCVLEATYALHRSAAAAYRPAERTGWSGNGSARSPYGGRRVFRFTAG